MRLFCFPHAGGGPATFRRWVNHLPESIEYCLVQLPGKERRVLEPPVRRMEDLVERIHAAIEPLLGVPFAFFGHSMGGKVAFELSRKLRRADKRGPVELFISASRAPRVPDPDPNLHQLPDAEFVSEIQSRYDGIPRDVLENPELLELVLPGLRADFELIETFVHPDEAPLEHPITCVGGIGDDVVGKAELTGWEIETSAGFALRMFGGDHFFIQTNESEFLEFFRGELERLVAPL